MSWNIQFGVEVEAAGRDLCDNPRLRGADIILLQEMDEVGTAALAESLSLNYVYASPGTHPQSGRNFGNAILTPWPLGEADVVALPFKAAIRGQERVLLHAQIRVGEETLEAGSVHTEVPSLRFTRRLLQFDEIASAVARWPGRRLVVGGDFNTVTTRAINALTRRMTAVGATRVSADAGATLRRGGREFTLDHVFVRGFDRVDAGVVTGSAASDHRPVWATVGDIGPHDPRTDV